MQRQLFDLACSVCGRIMINTPSGYICCPVGHGRLLVAIPQADETYREPDLFVTAEEEAS